MKIAAFVLVWVISAFLAGCSTGQLPVPIRPEAPTAAATAAATPAPTATPAPVTLRYAVWDARLAPAYAACAQTFMAQNPNLTVSIEQTDLPQYWDKLNSELQSGKAPDVFVIDTAHLADLTAAGYPADLAPAVKSSGLDDSVYIGRLPRLWIRAGQRFGMPKNWDTLALVYNKDLLAKAGVTAAELDALDWNPTDGGTFEQLLARLTLDKAGHNAVSPDFQSKDIAAYGLTMAGKNGGGAYGQAQWGNLAANNGFTLVDYLNSTHYNYASPALSATLAWLQRLINQRGYLTPFDLLADQGGQQLFLDGKAAMIADGSWMIGQYVDRAPFKVGFAPLPAGPAGRKSMFSGQADAIWAGTTHPDEAWKWVQYLGSVACQMTVGDAGVVFPALESGIDRMVEHYAAKGVDIRPFIDFLLDPDAIVFPPVTGRQADIEKIVAPVIEGILRGKVDPATALPAVNEQVNALFAP